MDDLIISSRQLINDVKWTLRREKGAYSDYKAFMTANGLILYLLETEQLPYEIRFSEGVPFISIPFFAARCFFTDFRASIRFSFSEIDRILRDKYDYDPDSFPKVLLKPVPKKYSPIRTGISLLDFFGYGFTYDAVLTRLIRNKYDFEKVSETVLIRSGLEYIKTNHDIYVGSEALRALYAAAYAEPETSEYTIFQSQCEFFNEGKHRIDIIVDDAPHLFFGIAAEKNIISMKCQWNEDGQPECLIPKTDVQNLLQSVVKRNNEFIELRFMSKIIEWDAVCEAMSGSKSNVFVPPCVDIYSLGIKWTYTETKRILMKNLSENEYTVVNNRTYITPRAAIELIKRQRGELK